MEFKDVLQKLLVSHDMKPSDLCRKTGIPTSLMSNYLAGKKSPGTENSIKIAGVFNVSLDMLAGRHDFLDGSEKLLSNILPIETRKIPLLGTIAAGQPIYADEDFEHYVDCGTGIRADFALRVKGDSMINARINDSDIVFIRKQPTVDNGEIAAIAIDDEVTLKRFYKYDNHVILHFENPAYRDIEIELDESSNIRILGKAVAFQSDIK